MSEHRYDSIESLIFQVRDDYGSWNTVNPPWFRGEPEYRLEMSGQTGKLVPVNPLVPKLFRNHHDELLLLSHFRLKAPTLGMALPPRENTDQWLFLAQHFGVPTRLLDWTEGLLFALYFAIHGADGKTSGEGGVVWMLNPIELNRRSLPDTADYDFPITWTSPDSAYTTRTETGEWLMAATSPEPLVRRQLGVDIGRIPVHPGSANIRLAWSEHTKVGTTFPIAILPTNIHTRMTVQRSCFTIHGRRTESICQLLENDDRVMKQYALDESSFPRLIRELKMLGVSHSTLFPDLDGLGRELGSQF